MTGRWWCVAGSRLDPHHVRVVAGEVDDASALRLVGVTVEPSPVVGSFLGELLPVGC